MKKGRRPLWAGGFSSRPGEALAAISLSHPFDRRMAFEDLAGTRAHARGLRRVGLLSKVDLAGIEKALVRIEKEIASGRFRFRDLDEDVHLNIERRLIELAGKAGRRIHAGRSRNDQVALDLRLWTLGAIGRARLGASRLAHALLARAEEFLAARVVVAARTHLRSAQPVLLAHVFHAYAEMLSRDLARLADARTRTAVSPLGSGACAGSTLPLDREGVARELNLPAITANSLDAVSDRDFAAEFEFAAALTLAHLSRLSEDLILWTGEEYSLFHLSEASTTGSSMMPQKKNPDSLELARGKSGRVFGDLLATLTVLKGLPLSYDRDLQETQEPLFDASQSLDLALSALTEVVAGLVLRPEEERPSIEAGALATDVAEELVRRGIPFRTAHEEVARWTQLAEARNADLRDIAAAQDPKLRAFLAKLTPASSTGRRDLPGGTAPRRVKAAIARTRRAIEGPFRV